MGLDIYFRKNEEKNYGYFREVSFLTDWIAEHICDFDNCQKVVIEKHHIEKLLNATQKVLANKTDATATEYLPCLDYPYDEIYYEEVEDVKNFCEKTLKEIDFDKDTLFFQAWW